MPPEILGPLGLTVALGFAVLALWQQHLRADADDRVQRDRALDLVEGIIPVVRQMAAAQEQANRDAAERHRRSDG